MLGSLFAFGNARRGALCAHWLTTPSRPTGIPVGRLENLIRMGNTQLVRAAGLLFDNDGVLVDSTAAVEESWRAFAGRYDLPIDAVLERVHGRRSRDVIAYYADRLPVSADEAFARADLLAADLAAVRVTNKGGFDVVVSPPSA